MRRQAAISMGDTNNNIYRLGIGFVPVKGRLDGSQVMARGLHGVLYHVLEMADRQDKTQEATWLHQHEAPKPYTLVPYYVDDGSLAGIQISAVGDRSATALTRAWLLARESPEPLLLGRQPLRIGETELVYDGTINSLVMDEKYQRLGLRFLSPTSFKKGPGDMPLPMPESVFRRPFQVWNHYSHPLERLPDSWLEWCANSVYITKHRIETVDVRVGPGSYVTGFVGEVWYEPYKGTSLQRRMLAALSRLAGYAGVGRKTTMGLGAVEFLGTVN